MPRALRTSFAALFLVSAATRAAEPLTQVTISVYSGGREVAGWVYPIGERVGLSAMANKIEKSDKRARYSGNVMGQVETSGGRYIVFGDEVVLTRETITPERVKAVHDLEAMAGPDQKYRAQTMDGHEPTPEEWKLQTAIDAANMKRLAEIIEAYGWPGVRFAGRASSTAFLVLQHADHDSQRRYLPLLRDAVKRNDSLGSQLAMLEDRVRIADGKPQLYGTQLSAIAGGALYFDPIEDEAHVDDRRGAVGLQPLAEYAKLFGLTYTPVKGPAAP